MCSRVSVAAGSRPQPLDTHNANVLDTLEIFCRAWASTYDIVFLTHDHYHQPSDHFRTKVSGLQHTADTTLRQLYHDLDIPVIDVPTGLETAHRVEWITQRVNHFRLGLTDNLRSSQPPSPEDHPTCPTPASSTSHYS